MKKKILEKIKEAKEKMKKDMVIMTMKINFIMTKK